MQTKIEISFKTIITIVLVVLGIMILRFISDIVIEVFVAFVLMSALDPVVAKISKGKIPRIAAILMVYAGLLIGIIIVIGTLVPPVIDQTTKLFSQLNMANSPILGQLSHITFTTQGFSSLVSVYGGSVSQVLGIILSAFSSLFTFFTMVVISIYMLLGKSQLHEYIQWCFRTKDKKERSQVLVERVENSLGSWVRGELVMMVTIAIMAFVGLRLLNIPYALSLAIFAGLMETLPNIGPTLAAIPAVIVAFVSVSPLMALFTVVVFALIQLIEGNVIVPQVMSRVVGIRPVVTIVLILVGFRFGGIIGAFLSIPLYIVGRELFAEFDWDIKDITKQS